MALPEQGQALGIDVGYSSTRETTGFCAVSCSGDVSCLGDVVHLFHLFSDPPLSSSHDLLPSRGTRGHAKVCEETCDWLYLRPGIEKEKDFSLELLPARQANS